MYRTVFAASLLIVAALPVASPAQAPGGTDGPRQAAFQTLQDSQWVRLAEPGLGRQQGRLLERSSTELVLSPRDRPIRVPAVSIDTLWTRKSSVKQGAIVGGVLGVLTGAGMGLLLSGMSDDQDFSTGQLVLGMGGIGAAGGGLLGALVGLAIPRWHRRYP